MVDYGIIAAMQAEAAPLMENMQEREQKTVSGITFTKGALCGKSVVLAVCGIGKVFAALCAQTMILQFAPQRVINTGVAGSLDAALSIGDLVIADRVVQHDMDTSALGDPVGLLSGIDRVFLPGDAALIERLQSAAADSGIPCKVGTVASGDQFVGDEQRKRYIRDTFGAAACEMEGAAIGQVCYVSGVPFAVVRAISDDANGGAQMDYPAFVKMAAARSAALVRRMLER